MSSEKSGYVVDVGCNDPLVNSNSLKLYRRGWRGINIDANAALIAKFAAVRPRDCNVRAIVLDVEEDKQFGVYDVEGHDLEVLKSLDLGRYQPKLVVVEMHGFDVTTPAGNPVYDYLAQCGYKLSSYALMNGFLMRVGE